MSVIREKLLLLFFLGKYLFFTWKEEREVRRRFYTDPLFKKIDTLLKKRYARKNPYHICKSYRKACGKQDLHNYGETPLTSMHTILSACSLKKNDVFLDLGAGRGRLVLFVATLWNIQAEGIEQVPEFCRRIETLLPLCSSPARIMNEDFLQSHLSQGSLLYFYALCLEDEVFYTMLDKMSLLPCTTRIITVSFALEEYSPKFTTLFHLEGIRYPWGSTSVYINAPQSN
ncbi:MAG: hypothetical protein FJZ58_03190 [Chlamydiae bacterium]|nr:hypothetical protein [Chlamydiota bacterium]